MPTADSIDQRSDRKRPPVLEPIAMHVPEACRYLGICRSTLYAFIGKGEVECIKPGSATLVLTASLRSLVERRRKPEEDRFGEAGR